MTAIIFNASTKNFTFAQSIKTGNLTHHGKVEFAASGGKWRGLDVRQGTYELYTDVSGNAYLAAKAA